MAPQSLHWQAIQDAKAQGYALYDLNGIKPANRTLHKNAKEQQWEGLTRFKKSFGGKEINYIGAWDWVYSKPWYTLYSFIYSVVQKIRT